MTQYTQGVRLESRARLLMRADLRDAEGEPRFCLALADRRHPVAFASIRAALDAAEELEAKNHTA